MRFKSTLRKAAIIGIAAGCLGGCAGFTSPASPLQAQATDASAVGHLVQGDTSGQRRRLPCYRPDGRRKDYGGEYYEVRAGQLVRIFRCPR